MPRLARSRFVALHLIVAARSPWRSRVWSDNRGLAAGSLAPLVAGAGGVALGVTLTSRASRSVGTGGQETVPVA